MIGSPLTNINKDVKMYLIFDIFYIPFLLVLQIQMLRSTVWWRGNSLSLFRYTQQCIRTEWRQALLSWRRKCRPGCPLFTRASVLYGQVRSSMEPRNLVLLTVFMAVLLMRSGVCYCLVLLKLTIISCCLVDIEDQVIGTTPLNQKLQLLSPYFRPWWDPPWLWFRMWLFFNLAWQSWVIRVKTSGLRTLSWGEPVLSEMTLKLTGTSLTVIT